MAKAFVTKVTHKRVRELLSYDRETGLLTWRVGRRGIARAGDEAGTPGSRGNIVIGIDNSIYSAARIVWFYCHGTWPPRRLFYADNDKSNLRLRNLVLAVDRVTSPQAVYMRKWRARRALINAAIAASPTRRSAWLKEPERVYAEVEEELRERAARHGDQYGVWE